MPEIVIGPPMSLWKRPKMVRFIAREGWDDGTHVAAKIARHDGWWDLDDVFRQAAGGKGTVLDGWRVMKRADLPAVVEALGAQAGRLRVRELVTSQLTS